MRGEDQQFASLVLPTLLLVWETTRCVWKISSVSKIFAFAVRVTVKVRNVRFRVTPGTPEPSLREDRAYKRALVPGCFDAS